MGEFTKTVVSILQFGPARWDTFVAGVPDSLLRRAPLPGEWSALDCLQHLIDVEVVFAARARALAEGRDIPAFDPDTDGEVGQEIADLSTLLERFRASRAISLEMLGTIQDESLDRQARHEELGMVSLRELLNEWAGHDLLHMVQAERAVMQPFIVGTGKWRHFFADHDVELAQS